MNPQKILAVACVALGIGTTVVATKEYLNVMKAEKAKREQIRIETDKQIAAIRRAGLIVQEKIQNGDYDSNILNVIPTLRYDQEFYTIIERIDD